MRPIHQGNPDGVNHHTPYPIAKGIWDYCAPNVVRAFDVRVQAAPAAGSEQPALDALARVGVMLADRFQIEKAALGGVAFFGHDHLDTR